MQLMLVFVQKGVDMRGWQLNKISDLLGAHLPLKLFGNTGQEVAERMNRDADSLEHNNNCHLVLVKTKDVCFAALFPLLH